MGPDFNGNQKTTKKFPTRVTKKDKKIQTFLAHTKNAKKGSQIQSQKKSFLLKCQKFFKELKNGVLKYSLTSDDIIIIGNSDIVWVHYYW